MSGSVPPSASVEPRGDARLSVQSPRVRRRFSVLWGMACLAALLALGWSRMLHPAYLVASALLGAAALPLTRRAGRDAVGAAAPALYAALGALAFALAAGFLTERRLDRIASDWDRLVAERTAERTAELDRRMAVVLARGREAATRAAALAARPSGRGAFADLAELRAQAPVAALAVFDEAGELIAWTGDHRGSFPVSVQAGRARVLYAERPLFSYLYFAQPVPGRAERAVAAVLLQTGLPLPGGEAVGIADMFAARTGARPVFAAGPAPDAAWSLVEAGDTVVHARFEPQSQAQWRAAVALAGQRAAVGFAFTGLLLLVLAWQRAGVARREAERVAGGAAAPRGGAAPPERAAALPGSPARPGRSRAPLGRPARPKRFPALPGRPAPPLLVLAAALAIAPLGAVLGIERPFSPAFFLLPGPADLSLGRLFAILLPLAALAAAATPPMLGPRRLRLAVPLGAAIIGIGFAGGLRLLLSATALPLLEGGPLLWGGLQALAVLLLTIVAGLALPWGKPVATRAARRARPFPIVSGLALALALALVVLARWQLVQRIDPWFPMLWAAPFALVASGLAPWIGRGGRVVRWLAAGVLAASAVLPHVWVAHVDARLEAAERELSTLGTRADPFLDYLLRRFAVEAQQRSERGESGVDLLYRAWAASGLARESYTARITLWSAAGVPLNELGPEGTAESMYRSTRLPLSLQRIFERARASGQPVVEAAHDAPGINQVLAVPLEDGRLVSVVVPPRRTLDRTGGLAPLLGAEPGSDMRLTLVPAMPGSALPPPGTSHWSRTERGWQSEARVRYPEGPYHAHLELRFPSFGVLFARGILLLALDLGVLAALWLVGRAAGGAFPTPPGGWTGWLGSFRARVTLALFTFFLIPTILFGAVAYRALAGEVTRAARMVAERAVAQAVAAFEQAEGDLGALAARVGEEVLYYHRGELAGASSYEAFELGVYGAWMPPSVYFALQSGEDMGTIELRELGQRPYLVAYRRLPVAGTLAVPVSLAAGDAAIRQGELAHLVLFAALIGGLLSLTLSLAVGRALAGPIGRLGRAAMAVGAGRLDARLPEGRADEFGELFASFNRMVRRLRRARAQELRTARVLAWGEMARQVAHEIKNPLTPIKLSVQHLRRAYADRRPDFGAILDSNVDQILAEIDRLTEIARVFSRYGAPAEAAGALEPVDVAAVIREALTLYRAGDSGIEYRETIEPGLPTARARAGELKEVLLNLLENARAALDGRGGRVEVSAHRGERGIELVVRDDGEGIAPDLLPRIFDPHFSTRSAGTGLGLAIVRRLVESWGGTVTAESESARGTIVRVRIPSIERPTTVASGN